MDFASTFYLKRAGRYSNPLNTNDLLPVVYGCLASGTSGNWAIPAIDTINFVYCLAAHGVLSVANNNEIAVYVDGVLESPANYTFNEAHDYESLGNIATITFDADKENAEISVRSKGKHYAVPNDDTLIENMIDIVEDFLTVENDFIADEFESTSKIFAKAIFESQGYKAAGVINEDIDVWGLLQTMVGSFLGNIYFNAQKMLVLSIDDNSTSYLQKQTIRKVDLGKVTATQKLENIINQCPCNYGYSYLDSKFQHHTDDSADADIISQNFYGVRKPKTPYQFYWCRDLTSVSTVQAIIVEKFKNPVWEVTINIKTLKELFLDTEDLLVTDIDFLYDDDGNEYIDHEFKIITVKPNFSKNIIQFKVIDI